MRRRDRIAYPREENNESAVGLRHQKAYKSQHKQRECNGDIQ